MPRSLTSSPQAGDTDGDNQNPIILVVDDDPTLQKLMREVLAQDYHVLVAENGEEAIHTAREILPDLVVCDVTMPVMDGYRVCHTLKSDQRTSHIPVILLTARIEPENRVSGFEAGADSYVTKPFLPSDLLAQVRNLISLREVLRERFRAGVVLKPGEVAAPSTEEKFLRKVQDVIEKHMGEENIPIESLCREIGISRSQVHRKLVALCGMSFREYSRYLRLHRANHLLKANAGNVSEIAYQVGFGSVAYFSKCFRELFGKRPSEARNGDD